MPVAPFVMPPSLQPIMDEVHRRLVMQQGAAQATEAYAPLMQQIQNQQLPPEALSPLPPDISNGKAAGAIALTNLGAALTSLSGVRGLQVDPNTAFNTVQARRAEIRGVQRENARTQAAFTMKKQDTLNDTAGKAVGSGLSLGASELERQQRESEFARSQAFQKWNAETGFDLQKREQDLRVAIAKMQIDADTKAKLDAATQGLGRDMGIVLATLKAQSIDPTRGGTMAVYLPDRSLVGPDAAKAPKDPTTGLPMRLFTSRAAVEAYMDGMISSMPVELQRAVKDQWMTASAPIWAEMDKSAKVFQDEARKRAEAAAKEELKRKEQAAQAAKRESPMFRAPR